jgi:isopentenyl-diphosphate delta-isomerase
VKDLSGLEEVDLVDDDDTVIGSASLSDCLAKGLLHRAVAVLVLRSTGTVVLQRRSESDLWNPGLWTISCTGHVKRGESYAEAAARELSEELALTSPVHQLFKFKLPPIRDRSLTENEWTAFFSTVTDAKVTPDPQELAGVEEVPVRELKRMVRRGPLTEDAKILFTKYLQHQGDYPPRVS